MTKRPTKLDKLARQSARRDERREAKRDELAQAAIVTLSQLGYARTSLRDIAEQTGGSVGLVHYYFEDKAELIIHCVRLFKMAFVQAVDARMSATSNSREATEAFLEAMVATLRDDFALHRLWDDIHAQAMFDDRFQAAVTEIEALLVSMMGRAFSRMGFDTELAEDGYTAIHGAFHYHLYQFICGRTDAPDRARTQLRRILDRLRP